MRLALPLALGLHGAVLAALLAWPTAIPPEPDEPPAMRVELAMVIGTGHDTAPAPQQALPEPEPPQAAAPSEAQVSAEDPATQAEPAPARADKPAGLLRNVFGALSGNN